VGVVDVLAAQGIDLVEHVEHIALRVDARPLDARHDLADHLLTRRCAWPVPQAPEVWEQLASNPCVGGRSSFFASIRPTATGWVLGFTLTRRV